MIMTETEAKTLRVCKDWNSFLYDQAGEIVAFKKNGKVLNVSFPEGAQFTALVILDGEVHYLEYFFNNTHVVYSSPNSYINKIYSYMKNVTRKIAIC